MLIDNSFEFFIIIFWPIIYSTQLECLIDPSIGWEYECAICWMEDIVCTKEHCTYIFLQSQMINNVGNFAVGPDDIVRS